MEAYIPIIFFLSDGFDRNRQIGQTNATIYEKKNKQGFYSSRWAMGKMQTPIF